MARPMGDRRSSCRVCSPERTKPYVTDLSNVDLPRFVEAYGKKWMCLQNVGVDDSNVYYVAIEAVDDTKSMPLPQPTFIISVPR